MVVAVLAAAAPPVQATSAAQEVGTCVAGADPAARWEKQVSPVEGDQALNSVFFLDETTGWAVGNGRTILRTVDGGESYERPETIPPTVPPGAILNDVFFLDKMNGWVVGANKVVLRTKDGGLNWDKVELPQSWPHIDLFGVWFTDPHHGYFVGGYSNKVLIYKETAAGEVTWSQSAAFGQSDTLRHVTFINPYVGFVSGDRGIWRTADAGENWASATLPGRVDFIEPAPALGFTSTANGYAVGGHETRIWRTRNGGESWDLHTSCPGPLVTDLAFVGDASCIGSSRCKGIAVGGAEGAISIFGTSDGGATWLGQQLPPGAPETMLRSVAYPTADTAYAVGQNGTIFKASIGLLPILTGISPPRGVSGGGTVVTITGKHLKGGASNADTKVTFDGVPGEVVSVEDGMVKAVAPAHPAGSAEVRVVTPAGTSLPVAFEYVPALVSGVDPNEGPVQGGTGVTIRGEGFTGSLAVRFGGQLALGFTVSPDGRTIQATAPPPAGNVPGPVTVSVVNPFGASEAATDGADTYTYLEVWALPRLAGVFHPLSSARIFTGSLLQGQQVDVLVAGSLKPDGTSSGVPATGVSAVSLAVTVTPPDEGGFADSFLTVWPTGRSMPTASNLNWLGTDPAAANAVKVGVGDAGKVSVYNQWGSAQVAIDVVGWYANEDAASGARYQPLTPARVLDSRIPASGTLSCSPPNVGAPFANDETRTVQVAGRGGVPAAGGSAVALNVTVATHPCEASANLPAAALPTGALTVWPANEAQPTGTNLRYRAGQKLLSTLVVTKLAPDGTVKLRNQADGPTHVVVDVQGWYSTEAPTGGEAGRFVSLSAPARFLDTRNPLFLNLTGRSSPDKLMAPEIIDLQVTGQNEVPAEGVKAVVMNVTVTQPSADSFVTVWPTGTRIPLQSNQIPGQQVPGVSTLNFVANQTVPNLVVVPVGLDGKVSFYNAHGGTHVAADVVGWFTGP